jgi:hypothetical protein
MDTSQIERYLIIGRTNQHWYKECEELLIELFGAENLVLCANLFAATSINTSLKANITLFRRAFYEIKNNIPVGGIVTGRGKQLGYLPNIHNQITRIREGRELSGRKIRAFAAAMSGDQNAVVVDVWLARAFNMERRYKRFPKGKDKSRGRERSAGVNDKDFSMVENYCRDLADKKGMQAREISSMVWAGVRIDKTGDTQTHYKELLKHKFTNLFNCF